MSQVDLSRQVLESFTDDNGDRGEGDFNIASSGDVGSCVRASASSSVSVADGGRSDRLPPAAHHHSGFGSTASSASSSTSTSAVHHESNYGILERCGRWLMAIPRDDVVALQQTSEYREFLSAFDKLGEVRVRVRIALFPHTGCPVMLISWHEMPSRLYLLFDSLFVGCFRCIRRTGGR